MRLLITRVAAVLLAHVILAPDPAAAQPNPSLPQILSADSTAKAPADTSAVATADPSETIARPGTAEATTIVDGQSIGLPEKDEKAWPRPSMVLLRSVVVPGWGQFTNRKYTKAAVVFGLESWFLANAISNWRDANRARDRVVADPGNPQNFADYEFYWGNRGDYLWLLGLTVFVSMFDAYVDAHLIPYQHDTIPGVEPPKGLSLVLVRF